MTINDSATLIIGKGNFFTGPVSTAMPADLTAVGSDWKNVGNTSLEDIFKVASDGGDATVVATLQNRSLRTSYSNRTETFTINLQQFDQDSLKLYYGSNAVINADGSVGVPQQPTPTVAAFLAVFVDGEHIFAFYAPKAEILRADDLELSNTEDLASLPLAVKPLAVSGNDWAYAVTPLTATS